MSGILDITAKSKGGPVQHGGRAELSGLGSEVETRPAVGVVHSLQIQNEAFQWTHDAC